MARPLVTIVMPSHLKPLVGEAIECVLSQTEKRWKLLIYDAGHWCEDTDSPMHTIYAKYSRLDPRIEWIITGDPVDFRERYCPVSYRYNQAVREGRLEGDYSCVMPDDDLIDPNYLKTMIEGLKKHEAVYCSQSLVRLREGRHEPVGELRATSTLTGDCVGRVDLLQVMWRNSVLERLEPPYFVEDPTDSVCRIQDGLFFDRLCEVTDGIHPIDQVLCTHRYNPQSTYSPM